MNPQPGSEIASTSTAAASVASEEMSTDIGGIEADAAASSQATRESDQLRSSPAVASTSNSNPSVPQAAANSSEQSQAADADATVAKSDRIPSHAQATNGADRNSNNHQSVRDLVGFGHAADVSSHHTPLQSAASIDAGDLSTYSSPSAAPSTTASPSKVGGTVLMASRKQNSACDACRSRKVRCNRDPGETKCNHCKAKNIECTTLYVEWATSSAKRPAKRARTSLNALETKKELPKPPELMDEADHAQDRLLSYLFQKDAEYASPTDSIYYYSNIPFAAPMTADGYTTRTILPASYFACPKPAATTNAELTLLNRQRREGFVNDMVETYFSIVHSRIPLLNPQTFKRRYYERPAELGGAPPDVLVAMIVAWGAKFSDNPLIASDRSESAAELQKAYAQAEAALAKGETEKAHQITGIKGGIDQPILTVPEELRNLGRNRLAHDLMWRAQEVMDRLKATRIPTVENIQACLLMECLLSHPSVLYSGDINFSGTPVPSKHSSPLFFNSGNWFLAAIKHLLDLGINQKENVMAIEHSGARGEIMFAWWLACFCDAGSAVFMRRRSYISAEAYNNNPPALTADTEKVAPHPLSNLDSYMAYYGSFYHLTTVQRFLSSMQWRPASAIEGIKIGEPEQAVEMLKKWRDEHLGKVGVPLPHWPPHWDYIAAVSACTTDINYHGHWILLWRILDEFGIYGTDRNNSTSPIHQNKLKKKGAAMSSGSGPSTKDSLPEDAPSADRVQALLDVVQEEALSSALRIAGLTEILRSNSYLRLDPSVALAAIEAAATFLIRFHRSESSIMIAGIRQYAISYEECFEKADILERMAAAYQERARNDPNFVPGSALGLALDRDAEYTATVDADSKNAGADQNGIPGLAIAAAAISNAAASASSDSNTNGDETFTYDPDHPQTSDQANQAANDDHQQTEASGPYDLNAESSSDASQNSSYQDLKAHINQAQEHYHAEVDGRSQQVAD